MTAAAAGVVALLLLVVGCGDDDAAPAELAPVWDGTATVDFETGDITAPGFNELIETSQPEWAADPREAAAMLLASVGEGADTLDVEGDTHVVTVVFEDLPDDSTAATRYVLKFEVADDGLVRFVSGTWGQRCQPGRGHQDSTAVPCT